jgi:hypothetical protein
MASSLSNKGECIPGTDLGALLAVNAFVGIILVVDLDHMDRTGVHTDQAVVTQAAVDAVSAGLEFNRLLGADLGTGAALVTDVDKIFARRRKFSIYIQTSLGRIDDVQVLQGTHQRTCLASGTGLIVELESHTLSLSCGL